MYRYGIHVYTYVCMFDRVLQTADCQTKVTETHQSMSLHGGIHVRVHGSVHVHVRGIPSMHTISQLGQIKKRTKALQKPFPQI